MTMTATSKDVLEGGTEELEALLPWHINGTLNPHDARRVEEALARNPALARQHAIVQEEYAEAILLNEALGVPSSRTMQKLFVAIDAEPDRQPQRNAGTREPSSTVFGKTLNWLKMFFGL